MPIVNSRFRAVEYGELAGLFFLRSLAYSKNVVAQLQLTATGALLISRTPLAPL